MHRIAANVAEEIRVLLDHDHRNAGAGKQAAEHDAGRAATDDATAVAGLLRAIDRDALSRRGGRVAQGVLPVACDSATAARVGACAAGRSSLAQASAAMRIASDWVG